MICLINDINSWHDISLFFFLDCLLCHCMPFLTLCSPSSEVTRDSASEVDVYSDEEGGERGGRYGRGRAGPLARRRPAGYAGGGRTDQRPGNSRIFVALFDYDPPTMSPNPEACEEELPFREGQLIKVR